MLSIDDLAEGFDTVIVAGTDVQGRLFGRRLPLRRFLQEPLAHVDICTCALVWDITQDLGLEAPFGGYHTGWHDFRLQPDLGTLRRYPGVPGTAVCLADMLDEAGQPVVIAPRTILRQQVDRLLARGHRARLATELEFYLFHGSTRELRTRGFRDLEPTTLVRSDYSIVGQAVQEPFIARVRREMDSAGVPIYACQAEYGLGQWEVNFDHADVLEMADRHVVYKAGLKELTLQEGLSVTFMARPLTGDMGSSCHLHCSLWDGDRPLFASAHDDRALSRVGRQWVAGILAHLDELAIFFAPYVNSYKRHLPDDVGGGIKAWGIDNRTVAVRVVGAGSSLRVELRYPGADVNPYLGAAAMIAAGLDGIGQDLDPGQPVTGNAYAVAGLGRTHRSLADALSAFRSSAFVAETFGPEVVAHYAAQAEAEWAGYLKAVTDWEVRRAFELV